MHHNYYNITMLYYAVATWIRFDRTGTCRGEGGRPDHERRKTSEKKWNAGYMAMTKVAERWVYWLKAHAINKHAHTHTHTHTHWSKCMYMNVAWRAYRPRWSVSVCYILCTRTDVEVWRCVGCCTVWRVGKTGLVQIQLTQSSACDCCLLV